MTAAWALQMALPDAAAAVRVRHLAGLAACVAGDVVWLCGPALDAADERLVRSLPATESYTVLADGQLVPRGARVPTAHLPEGPWEPLQTWLRVELEAAALPGRVVGPVPLRLVRGGGDLPADLLLTDVAAWSAYATSAPQVRLHAWGFAVAAGGRVLVRGRPLPPLPGERFVIEEGVARPAGWTWQPELDPRAIREVLGLADGEWALAQADGAWERLRETDFVRATRSAVRLSAASPARTPGGGDDR